MTVSVFLLDDYEPVRSGLKRLIEAAEDLVVVGEAERATEALGCILQTQPDVAILDVQLPDGSGIEVCRDVRSHFPQARCVLLTGHAADEALASAIMAGAAGYISKPVRAAELQSAIRLLVTDDPFVDPALVARVTDRLRQRLSADARLVELTSEARQVFMRILEGATNPVIGDALGIPEETVKHHVATVLDALRML